MCTITHYKMFESLPIDQSKKIMLLKATDQIIFALGMKILNLGICQYNVHKTIGLGHSVKADLKETD